MKRKNIETLPVADLELLKNLPHVLPKLVDLVMGEWEPTALQQEQLTMHLAECLYCQIALRQFVEAALDDDKHCGLSEEPGRQLLSQLTQIIHTTSIRDDIGAYIETVDAQGVDEANKQFPLLEEHLKACKACRSEVDGTLYLLQQAEQSGGIAPP